MLGPNGRCYCYGMLRVMNVDAIHGGLDGGGGGLVERANRCGVANWRGGARPKVLNPLIVEAREIGWRAIANLLARGGRALHGLVLLLNLGGSIGEQVVFDASGY